MDILDTLLHFKYAPTFLQYFLRCLQLFTAVGAVFVCYIAYISVFLYCIFIFIYLFLFLSSSVSYFYFNFLVFKPLERTPHKISLHHVYNKVHSFIHNATQICLLLIFCKTFITLPDKTAGWWFFNWLCGRSDSAHLGDGKCIYQFTPLAQRTVGYLVLYCLLYQWHSFW